jgi:hypothetical protein
MIAYIVIAAGLQFSPGTLVSSTNKSDSHDITQILLKVALNTIHLNLTLYCYTDYYGWKHLLMKIKFIRRGGYLFC